jgi:hypothetical protein
MRGTMGLLKKKRVTLLMTREAAEYLSDLSMRKGLSRAHYLEVVLRELWAKQRPLEVNQLEEPLVWTGKESE